SRRGTFSSRSPFPVASRRAIRPRRRRRRGPPPPTPVSSRRTVLDLTLLRERAVAEREARSPEHPQAPRRESSDRTSTEPVAHLVLQTAAVHVEQVDARRDGRVEQPAQ